MLSVLCLLSGVCVLQCWILVANSEGFSCGNTWCFEIPILLKIKALKT